MSVRQIRVTTDLHQTTRNPLWMKCVFHPSSSDQGQPIADSNEFELFLVKIENNNITIYRFHNRDRRNLHNNQLFRFNQGR